MAKPAPKSAKPVAKAAPAAKKAPKAVAAPVEIETPAEEPVSEIEGTVETDETALTPYDELMTAARAFKADFAPQHAKEAEHAFLVRLIEAVGGAPEDAWNAMESDGPAQTWYNDACQLLDDKKPVTAPEGMPPVVAEAPKAKRSAADALAEVNAKKKAAKEAAAGAAKPTPSTAPKPAKAEKAAKAPKAPKAEKAEGATIMLRRLVIENESITTEALMAELTKAGIATTPSTISTVRADTLRTLRVLRKMGRLPA